MSAVLVLLFFQHCCCWLFCLVNSGFVWSQSLCVCLGRIFQFVHGEEDVGMPPLINPQNLPGVVSTLLESTRDEPHIAEQICYALSQLAAGFKDSDTSLFSPYFADIVQALLQQVRMRSRIQLDMWLGNIVLTQNCQYSSSWYNAAIWQCSEQTPKCKLVCMRPFAYLLTSGGPAG